MRGWRIFMDGERMFAEIEEPFCTILTLARGGLFFFLGLALGVRVVVIAFLAVSHARYVRYCVHKHLPVPLKGRALFTYLRGEMTAIVRLVRCSLLFLLDGYRLGRSKNVGMPVICVHGYTQNGTNFVALRRVLERHGFATYAPSLGLPLQAIETHAKKLESAVDRALREHSEASGFAVVAHSMGGLVIRLVFARRPDLAARARAVVTLGTPHRGTAATRGFAFGDDVRVMHRGSSFLRDLPDLLATAKSARRVEIAARVDYVVYPTSTSLTPGSEHHVLDAPGHAGLLVSKEVHDIVLSTLPMA
jgi:pimeloyl-ACP methyl ester carboxylesterase